MQITRQAERMPIEVEAFDASERSRQITFNEASQEGRHA